MDSPLSLAANSLFQVAYVVPDLRVGIEHCTRVFGVTEFLTLRDVVFKTCQYRSVPSDSRQHLAFGFSGFTNLELIEPVSGPSLYSEFLLRHPGGGFHHVGYKVRDFDRARQDLLRDFDEIQSGCFGAGTRFAYFDTRHMLGHFTELLFFDEETDALFERLKGFKRAPA